LNDGTSLLLEALKKPRSLRDLESARWDELLCRARNTRLLAPIGLSLQGLGLLNDLPDRVAPQLEAECAIARENERMLRWEVNRIQRALRAIEVPVVLLKGAAYTFADLPAAAGRVSSDVDIMVPKAALDEVEPALLRAGWEAVKLDPYDQRYYRTWMHELPPLCHRDRHTLVDVHHTILPETGRLHPDARDLAAAARPIGDGLLVLAPIDMVLHSAAHLFQDGDLDGGLRDLVDLDSLLTHFGQDESFWRELVPRAQRLDLLRPLYYALRFCDKLFGCPIPADVLRASEVGAPPSPVRRLMDALTERAIVPDGWETPRRTTRLARFLLYVRSHWLRMPPLLLARHLTRKALSRGFPSR
jgi:hypothetical protein